MDRQVQFSHPVRYDDDFANWLNDAGISLLVSCFSANVVLLLSPSDEAGKINVQGINLARPMGIAVKHNTLAITVHDGIVLYQTNSQLSKAAENYDTVYTPYTLKVTGFIDAHDLDWGHWHEGDRDRLVVANTMFSCVALVEPFSRDSFTPAYIPGFIEGFDGTDRCHLNGVATRPVTGLPTHITMLTDRDAHDSWKEDDFRNGVLWSIVSDKPLERDLIMPHSPRWNNDELFYLESGRGTLNSWNRPKVRFPGLTRGLDFHEDTAIVGLSRKRMYAVGTDKAIDLPAFDQEIVTAGVALYDLESNKYAGLFEMGIGMDEVFSVRVLPHRAPHVASWGSKESRLAYRIAHSAELDRFD